MMSPVNLSQSLAVPVFVKGTHQKSGQEPEYKFFNGDTEHEDSAQGLELIGVMDPTRRDPDYGEVEKEGNDGHQQATQ